MPGDSPAKNANGATGAPWAGEDSYEAFVRQSISDMDRDLRFFDAHVLSSIDRRFSGDSHDVFQTCRSTMQEQFGSEDSVANLQFDFKRAWLAGQLHNCEQPKRQKDASDMLEFIQRHKSARATLDTHKAALAASDMGDFDSSSVALMAVLKDMAGLHDELMRANAQFPGVVAESDLMHMERWQAQRDSLEMRAQNRGHSVAVIGLEKTGKSTLCNALIGMRLLPAAVERCTMLTTRIRPSQDDEYRMEVTFVDEASFEAAIVRAAEVFDRKQREIEESRAAMDPDYDVAAARQRRPQFDAAGVRLKCQQLVGREPETLVGRDEIQEALKRYTANIDNMLAVSTVTVWTPELSAENMEVVDVPGFDSPLAAHREAAARSLNEADAFLFVTNGAANVDLTAPALELVRTIRKVAPQAMEKGYAVVTHLDTCSSRAEFQNRRGKAVQRLTELGFLETRIFCASPPLALLERERATGAAVGENLEHYEEMLRKARIYGVQLGFEQMTASLEDFVRTDLPRRRRGEALTLCRLAERGCSTAAEGVASRLKSFLPADQLNKLSLIEGKLSDATVDEIMSSIETSIARTHNSQWQRLWGEVWAHVNSSAADWLAANYFDRFDELSETWTRLFHEHYEAEKSAHSRQLYDKFKSRLSVLPIVLDEPDPCEAEMAHRVWLVDTVHRTLTKASARVAQSIFEVLKSYYSQLSRDCFVRFTDDVDHLQLSSAPSLVTEEKVRLKLEFNVLQAARLLEKRVLRYPSWHPRRVVREIRSPVPGLYDDSVPAALESHASGDRTALAMAGAAGTPQGFPKPRSSVLDYPADEDEMLEEITAQEHASAAEIECLQKKGIKAKKMPASRSRGRRGSVHATQVRVTEVKGERFVTWSSRKKKGDAVMLPLRDLEIRSGLASSKSFEALDAKARKDSDGRALSLRAGDKTLDLVLANEKELQSTVRALRDLKEQDLMRVPEAGEQEFGSDCGAADALEEKHGGDDAPPATPSKKAAPEPSDDEEADAAAAAAESDAEMPNMSGSDANDVRALEKGLAVKKMPHSRRGSIHKTKVKVLSASNGEKCIVYDSRNKWQGDIMIPVRDAVLREGPVTDAFDKLGKKKSKDSRRALSISGNNKTLDVVFDNDDEYERAVRGINALKAANQDEI